jgi:hypothetical protein
MLAALGQRDAERARGGDRVVEEQLVEITHPVELRQQRIGVRGLDLDVLLHQRRDALATQRLGDYHRLRQIVIGVIIAAGGSASMFDPIVVQPGILLDFRNIAAVLAGPLGGPIAAVIAAAGLAGARIYIGGSGTEAGVVGLMLCALIGLGVSLWLRRTARSLTMGGFVGLSLVAAWMPVVMITAYVPFPRAWDLMVVISGPAATAVNVAGALLIGFIIKSDHQRVEAMLQLEACTANMPGVIYQKIPAPGRHDPAQAGQFPHRTVPRRDPRGGRARPR